MAADRGRGIALESHVRSEEGETDGTQEPRRSAPRREGIRGHRPYGPAGDVRGGEFVHQGPGPEVEEERVQREVGVAPYEVADGRAAAGDEVETVPAVRGGGRAGPSRHRGAPPCRPWRPARVAARRSASPSTKKSKSRGVRPRDRLRRAPPARWTPTSSSRAAAATVRSAGCARSMAASSGGEGDRAGAGAGRHDVDNEATPTGCLRTPSPGLVAGRGDRQYLAKSVLSEGRSRRGRPQDR